MHLVYSTAIYLARLLARTLLDFRAYGSENIPLDGGCILAMNHESYLDPPLAAISSPREIHFLARKTLATMPVFGPFFPDLNVVFVDQDRPDMAALKTVIRLVKAGQSTIIFPEGARTEDGNLQPAQPGLGLVVARTLAPVVPMRIFGARAAFPRGGKPRIFNPVHIVIGEPMRFTEADLVGDSRVVYQAISERVMARIASLQPAE